MKSLEQDLADLLNRYSQENNSDTPDLILAEYLMACLRAFNVATKRRTYWYGADEPVSDLVSYDSVTNTVTRKSAQNQGRTDT